MKALNTSMQRYAGVSPMILFRLDGNSEIGMGHAMRCLSLAAALRERGKECVFATADDKLSPFLSSRGFPSVSLGSDYRHPDDEMPALFELLDKRPPSLIVVDHYHVSRRYLSLLRQKAKVAFFDDFGAEGYDVDAVINYNISADGAAYASLYPKGTRVFCGVRYAPLRGEFAGLEPLENRPFKNLLLSTGGADMLNIGQKLLLSCLAREELREVRFHLIVGEMNMQRRSLETLAKSNAQICLEHNVHDMAGLMRSCDAAVSASGSTLYELCACGLPSVCYTFADNQLAIANAFAREGLIAYGGDYRGDELRFADRLIDMASALARDAEKRRAASLRMQAVVDGRGADRLAQALLTLADG